MGDNLEDVGFTTNEIVPRNDSESQEKSCLMKNWKYFLIAALLALGLVIGLSFHFSVQKLPPNETNLVNKNQSTGDPTMVTVITTEKRPVILGNQSLKCIKVIVASVQSLM